MARTSYPLGATSISVEVEAWNLDGTPNESLAWNTPTIEARYWRDAIGTVTTITLATLASNTAAYSSGGFIQKYGNRYRFDLPDAVFSATGSPSYACVKLRGVTNVLIETIHIDLTASNLRTAVVLTGQQIADSTRDDFITMMEEGIAIPATTGNMTLLDSTGATRTIAITTNASAEGITGMT